MMAHQSSLNRHIKSVHKLNIDIEYNVKAQNDVKTDQSDVKKGQNDVKKDRTVSNRDRTESQKSTSEKSPRKRKNELDLLQASSGFQEFESNSQEFENIPKELEFECPKCERPFEDESVLKLHLKFIHDEDDSETENQKTNESQKDESWTDNSPKDISPNDTSESDESFSEEEEGGERKSKLKCGKCPKKFLSNTRLIEHIRRRHDRKRTDGQTDRSANRQMDGNSDSDSEQVR
jgi:hypothetical protein